MFNRGYRRDDRNNSFRSNMNMSHGHNNAPSLMSVSPWEGGVVPGSGGSSILGSPQLQNQSMLTPQAQALAQNLNILSNLGLLQPQLQTRQAQVLPSLVNMGSALNRSGMGMGQQHSNFNQMQNRGMANRFQDQRLKYGRQDGRRTEPFNKNRTRPSQSQNSQKLQSYRPLNSKVSPLQAARKPVVPGGDALARARADVRGKRPPFIKKESTKAQPEEEADEDAKKDEGEEVVKKRDWKKEKKSEVIDLDADTEEATTVKMEVEGEEDKSNGELKVEEKDKDIQEDKEGSGVEVKEKSVDKTGKPVESTIYNCHVCTKNFMDEGALSSHLRSMAHRRMMDQLEETYAIKVKRIRDQMRINEQQKELDMDPRRRRGMNIPRGHCKMCDLSFMGNITSHRKTPLHLKLKNFLHPNCVPCGQEFPARMEWDMHKLTVEHLKVASGIDKKKKNMGNSSGKGSEPNYAKLVPKFPEGLDSVMANMDEERADKVAAAEGEEEHGDGLKYDPAVVAGVNMLVHGQHCGVCNKFFVKRPDAMEHCKTRTHFDNYLAMKAKLKEEAAEAARVEAEAKAAAEAEAAAKAAALVEETPDAAPEETAMETEGTSTDAEAIEVTPVDPKMMPVICLKRASAEKDEGNWKRSRVRKNDDDEDEDDDEADLLKSPEAPEGTDNELPDKVVEELDKYDPLEPTSPPEDTPDVSVLETSFDLLNAIDADIDNMEAVKDEDVVEVDTKKGDGTSAKPANKARRGRKRK